MSPWRHINTRIVSQEMLKINDKEKTNEYSMLINGVARIGERERERERENLCVESVLNG